MKLRKMRLKPKTVHPLRDDESWTYNPKWRILSRHSRRYCGLHLFVLSITRVK